VIESGYEYITVETAEGIAGIALANAAKRNALSLGAMRELIAALEAVGSDDTVKVVILRALGPAFSSGHDLREIQGASEAANSVALATIFDTCVRLVDTIGTLRQPVIAEVTGIATAAGCQLVAACDLALASPEATFATPGVKIGLFCSTPMVALSRAIGRKRAMEMLLTGDFIDAPTAEAWGLINRVVPAAELGSATLALARKIAGASASTVGLGKAAFYKQIELGQSEAYAYAKEVMTANALEDDAREGIGAFLERRVPSWKR
jgi:enoyl-CoA hydratase/carnithine racemase